MNTDTCYVEYIDILSIPQNACPSLSLHLLRIGPACFALDHSPCARNDLDSHDNPDSASV